MMDSIKDCFMVALKKNGFSSNSLDESELQIATNDLIAQKPLVQAYVVDQVRDKMIGGEAAIGVMFSGDALYVMSENEDLDFVIRGRHQCLDRWLGNPRRMLPTRKMRRNSSISCVIRM